MKQELLIFSLGVILIILTTVNIVGSIFLSLQIKVIADDIKVTIDTNASKRQADTNYQIQLLRDGNELIACLIVQHDEKAIIEYDPAICKQRLESTDNFDGTFARDQAQGLSSQGQSNGQTQTEKTNTSQPSQESSSGLQKFFSDTGEFLDNTRKKIF